MDDCVQLARRLGERIGEELSIPVYLYEQAATRPGRQNLADVRKGEFEGIRELIGVDPAHEPDFGPRAMGKAGATAVGARAFLIAFNVYLNTDNVEIAKKIAKTVRHSSGGLRYVKALGLLVNGQAQVSMNLTDFRQTPIHLVVEVIRREATRYEVMISHTELVGMAPQQALLDVAAWYLQLDSFKPELVLENRLMGCRGQESPSKNNKPDCMGPACCYPANWPADLRDPEALAFLQTSEVSEDLGGRDERESIWPEFVFLPLLRGTLPASNPPLQTLAERSCGRRYRPCGRTRRRPVRD